MLPPIIGRRQNLESRMPFTFSHPAIVLPLTFLPKKWFSLTGLVIGSLIPDFEYFLRMKMSSNFSHTIDGLFWFDLPLGLLLAVVFHNIVRDRLIDNLPTFLKSRFFVFKQFDWNAHFKKYWLVVTISFLIGASSHIFWDSFTHNQGYFVQTFPVLSNKVDVFARQISVFRIIQHLSTLLGGLVIAFAISELPTDKKVRGQFDIKYWSVLTLVTLIIIAVKLLNGLDVKLYGQLIVTAISAGLISLTLTPLLTKD